MNESSSQPSFDPALLQAQAAFSRSRFEAKSKQVLAAKASESPEANVSEARRKRRQASLDFQSMIMGQMLKAMRRTVGQSSDMGGEGAEKPSMGREIFTEMLDGEYAGLASRSGMSAGEKAWESASRGGGGLAGQIYRSLSRQAGETPSSDIHVFQASREAAFRSTSLRQNWPQSLSSSGSP
jgi:hypothetical protein